MLTHSSEHWNSISINNLSISTSSCSHLAIKSATSGPEICDRATFDPTTSFDLGLSEVESAGEVNGEVAALARRFFS